MAAETATQSAVNYLVQPETVIEADGEGAALELGTLAGKPLLIVLRIDEIIEQESLQVSIWGSPDGQQWGEKALFWYPQKFYRGGSPAALDLSRRAEIKFLKARWETNRWGRGYPRPYFKFVIEVQELPAS
jgi:hypothetical protein